MWEVYLEWWQACVLLVDGGLARYGENSPQLGREKVQICGRCVWLQRAMINGVLVRFSLFCFDQELTVCFFL